MNRRHFIRSAALGMAALAARPALAAAPRIEVLKTATCGCCSAWLDHLRANGIEAVARDVPQELLWTAKGQAGITPELSACHTGMIDGYVIEGHVPAADILRLVAERPDAVGLTVPGMPIGSPGMEMGSDKDPYDTLLILRDGTTQVFAHHA